MPIRWYSPAGTDPNDPTYRHFERIVNFCLHAGVFAAVNSGAWFVQQIRHPLPDSYLPMISSVWGAVLAVQLFVVIRQRPAPVN